MKVKAVIIEDEFNARQALQHMIAIYCPDIELIGEAEDVESGAALLTGTKPELVFLDIHMPDGTGFELLRRIKKPDFKIIFVTAYDQYALQAIKLSAVDYILKPVNPKELQAAVAKVGQMIEREGHEEKKLITAEENFNRPDQSKKIILNTSTNLYVVRLENIVQLLADENYTKVYTTDGQMIMVSRTLKEFDDLLSPIGFCRTHNSHLINLEHVKHFEKGLGGGVIMSNDANVPVSSRRKDYFLQRLSSVK